MFISLKFKVKLGQLDIFNIAGFLWNIYNISLCLLRDYQFLIKSQLHVLFYIHIVFNLQRNVQYTLHSVRLQFLEKFIKIR